MALLPTLAEQILNNMDVEQLTFELKMKSTSKVKGRPSSPEITNGVLGPSSGFLLPRNLSRTRDDETRSEASADSIATTTDSQGLDTISPESTSHLAHSTTSWVENLSASGSLREMSSPGVGSDRSDINLSDSITSVGSGMTSMSTLVSPTFLSVM